MADTQSEEYGVRDDASGAAQVAEPVLAALVSDVPFRRTSPAQTTGSDLPPRGTPAEMAANLAMVVLADLLLYRTCGYTGMALLLVGAMILFWLGHVRPALAAGGASRAVGRPTIFIAGLGLMLALRMVWLGNPLHCLIGFALLVAFAASLHGFVQNALMWFLLSVQILPAGLSAIAGYVRAVFSVGGKRLVFVSLAVGVPLVALAAFSVIFVAANPDLAKAIQDWCQRIFDRFDVWLTVVSPGEVVLWILTAWFTAGLLRPILPVPQAISERPATHPDPAGWYVAFRNTLVALVALFAVYLAFEFKTLWFREFPKGFYYGGYAHEGAAWLTVALALSTGTLSIIFRRGAHDEAQAAVLRRWAWIWSVENLILAATVYHRMYIYIAFNGMTFMRVVGLFGSSIIVAGFILVLWKTARGRSFLWLVRGQGLAVAAAIYLFALTPVDAWVYAHNTRHILNGDLAPSVQITVHSIDESGLLQLLPLVHCRDPIIRDGVRAMLAEGVHPLSVRGYEPPESRDHWTDYQYVSHRLRARLDDLRPELAPFDNVERRREAIARFREYAYQWY